MKILEAEQRSPEWYAARLGRATASSFPDIFTGTGKVATASKQETYKYKLIAEWMTGEGDSNGFDSYWMKRGRELEPLAREAYEFISDNIVEETGFCMDEERLLGCSPDGFIMNRDGVLAEGVLEIKCPAPHTHAKYLATLSDKPPVDYIPQIQGQLLITGLGFCDFLSYCPGMDPLLIRVPRDDSYIEGLELALVNFLTGLELTKGKLIAKGHGPAE